MIIDRLEDFLRRDEEMGHFPYGHFKIHLGELEQPVRHISITEPGLRGYGGRHTS